MVTPTPLDLVEEPLDEIVRAIWCGGALPWPQRSNASSRLDQL